MDSGSDPVESTVTGYRVRIPARIRRELDVADGDTLRWRLVDEGAARVEAVRQERRTFADFDGYDGDEETDVRSDHDAWAIE